MVDVSTIVTIIYSIPIILIPRFRHRLHAFTINTCITMLCCSIYWFVYCIMTIVNVHQFYQLSTCSIVLYTQIMCTLQVPLALMVVSIHRLCCVVHYAKTFFKTKLWISVCILCQWLVGILISLPTIIRNPTICAMPFWMNYYVLMIIIIIPVLLYIIINVIIFKYVQSSTRRIQPRTETMVVDNNSVQQLKLNRRDIHLLRHMIIMFFVFVIGWCPIYITTVVNAHIPVDLLILKILSLLAEISLFCNVIDLFLYSHDLRQFLKSMVMPCYHS
ncbi:hypothetical protein I4U23_030257 [Adineta vaga]|nr:hypothetical protein I4U23_030257 [Adineta vaga]